jgi:hypothetical protein
VSVFKFTARSTRVYVQRLMYPPGRPSARTCDKQETTHHLEQVDLNFELAKLIGMLESSPKFATRLEYDDRPVTFVNG